MRPLLEVDSVGRRFGTRQLLTCASLRARRGRVTALLGRNGAGKTTLFRIATGTVRPDTGAVRFDGVTSERPRHAALARRGLYLVPDRASLSPTFTVGEHVRMAARRFGTAPEGLHALLDVASLQGRRPSVLSVGELRRAELAVALATSPSCLLLDEPLRELAPLDAATVQDAVRRLAASGAAVVISGHQATDLLAIADDVCWCHDGTTVEFASADAARDDVRFRQQYLGLG